MSRICRLRSALIDRWFIKQPKLRRLITTLIFGTKDRDIQLCGRSFCVNSLRENGYLRAAMRTEGLQFYRELPLILKLSSMLQDGDTFLDVGANVGIVSALVVGSNGLKRDIRGFAFEPHPDTYLRLCKNVHGLPITALNLAIGSDAGPLDMVDGAVSHVFTSASHAGRYNDPDRRIRVECRRLDDLDFGEGPLCIKVDVEGQELEVLKSARRLLDAGRIRWIYFDGCEDSRTVMSELTQDGFLTMDLESGLPATHSTFALFASKEPI